MTIIALLMIVAPPASNAELAAARAHFDGLRFNEALAAITSSRERANSHADLIDGYRLEGLTRATLGDINGARDAFRRLLMLRSDFQLDDSLAPRFRKLLDDTRERFSGVGWLQVEDVTPPNMERPQASVRINNDPLGMIESVRLVWRGTENAEWQLTTVAAKTVADVQLPLAPDAPGFWYYWLLLDGLGSELGLLGSASAPLHATLAGAAPGIQTTEDTPLWQRWWLWAAIGVVVVAGVTTAAVLASMPQRPGCPTGATCLP